VIAFVLVSLRLLLMHGANNEEIAINIGEISSIRQVLGTDEGDSYFHKEVKCVLVMTNGRFIGVREPCIEVIHKISDAAREK
jgi:hypothetical protein